MGERQAAAEAARDEAEALMTSWVKLVSVGGALTNGDYECMMNVPDDFNILEIRSSCRTGTCTATVKIDTVPLGGSANSVSTVSNSQVHASANSVPVGGDVTVTISANAGCEGMILWAKIEGVI
jgi:hypothetical protein